MAIEIQVGNPNKDRSPIVGIDLGTTNSLVAYVPAESVERHPVILKSRDGRNLVPSVVSLVGDKPVVGGLAKKNKVLDASHTVFSVKRLLGRGLEDVGSLGSLPYRLISEEGRNGMLRIQLGDRVYSAIEISAMILRELKANAEQELGVPVTRAVITVPAYFNDSQRQATRMAGRLAGLDVLRIVNEPTAASLAYGLNRKKQGLIAVYDLGGGTFDVSILKLHDGIFEVLATNGDSALGGDDLDQAIVAVAVADIQKQFGVDPLADPQLHAGLLEAAENLKIALSEKSEATLQLQVSNGKIYSRRWLSAEFEALILPVLERTRSPCLQALKDAGLEPEDLSDVVMVGGPTRLKVVQQIARDIFKREPNTSVHPDEVVAAGAAIQADILAGNNREFLLLDVVPLSLGLETYGGLMSTLIPRNTRLPTVAREVFTTFVDNQTAVDVHVLQGERERVEDNRSLARFKLKGIQPMPAGMPRVEVTFLIDADGILQVAAKDLKTGNEQSVEVRPTYGLTDAEVEKMLLASLENAEKDVAYRKLAEVRNEGRTVLHAAEKKLPEAYRLLSPEDASRVEQAVRGLRVALEQENPEVIRKATTHLSQATVRLAELLLKDVIAEAVDRKPLPK